MSENIRRTAELGELVVTAFDLATAYSADPKVVSRLATMAVLDLCDARRGHRSTTIMSTPRTGWNRA